MEGWIKLHRAIQSNDLWTSEPFSRGQAWVDLLLLANHKESFFYKRGNKVIIKRGQVGRSEVELSDRWKWSRTKVRKFLKDLEKEQQIKITKSRITQVLTIVNYNVYQEKEQQTGQQKDSRRTTEKQQKNTYKKDKKEKKDINKDINIVNYKLLVSYFVNLTGKTIRIANTDAKILKQGNYKLIQARFKDGVSLEEMKSVIDFKNTQWKDDNRNRQYIRFETLFAPLKYQKYLNELDNHQEEHKTDTKPQTLIDYFLTRRKYKQSKIDMLKHKGLLSKLEKKYAEVYNQLTEWQAKFDNPEIDEPFIFDVCYSYLGNFLKTKDPNLRLDAFRRIRSKQNDYVQRKQDFIPIMEKIQEAKCY